MTFLKRSIEFKLFLFFSFKNSIQSVVGCIKGSMKTLHQFSLNYPVWMLSTHKFIATLVLEWVKIIPQWPEEDLNKSVTPVN